MTRTHDLLITNQLLYRLSYTSVFKAGVIIPHVRRVVKQKMWPCPGAAVKQLPDSYLRETESECLAYLMTAPSSSDSFSSTLRTASSDSASVSVLSLERKRSENAVLFLPSGMCDPV